MKMPMRGKRYRTIEEVKQALFAPTIDLAMPTGSNDFRVAGNTLYTTVGTTSRAYETLNHLRELGVPV